MNKKVAAVLDIFRDNISESGINWKRWRTDMRLWGYSDNVITAIENLDWPPRMDGRTFIHQSTIQKILQKENKK